MTSARLLFSLLAFWCAASATGATRTQADLLLPVESAIAGETFLAGVRLKMAPRWHTYWRNPGDSGAATKIQWTLPDGITAGEIRWPVPEKFTAAGLTTYVYHDEAILLIPITVGKEAAPGPKEITARVSWLECEELCLPGKATVQATFSVGAESKSSANAQVLIAAAEKIPKPDPSMPVKMEWEKPAGEDQRPLLIEVPGGTNTDFFPYENPDYAVQPATEVTPVSSTQTRLRKVVKKSAGEWPKAVSGLLVLKANDSRIRSVEITATIVDGGIDGSGPAMIKTSSEGSRGRGLGSMLFLAFLGGLILNIMPCVLPVIALKILGFVNQTQETPGQIRRLGLVYAAGVLVSFMVLAGLVIGVKQAGKAASWGMQFSNPQFIVLLTVLITLVALNLFGVFEITLAGRAMGGAVELSSKQGAAGAFFNGVLATVLATPCTAPFLGVALGFAFGQPPVIIVVVFIAIALGLATPYVVLSWRPEWLKFLPKPGRWMERFKVAMGFPMLATAVWLFTLTVAHYGKRVWWLGLFVVLVALAAWLYGEFFQRGQKRRGLALLIALLVLGGGFVYAIENQLRWREPIGETTEAGTLQESPDGIAWRAWSPEALARARSEGRPVLVDFTADWCVTCQVNKKTSLEITSVRAKLREIDAVALLGDYTRLPPVITAELARFNSAGVPLVLVYPRNTNAPPQVLPTLLTPNIVLRALDEAAR